MINQESKVKVKNLEKLVYKYLTEIQSLKEIINNLPGSIYWKSKQGIYLDCNDFMIIVAGLNSKNDLIGKSDYDLWPNQAKEFIKNDLKVMATGKSIEVEEYVVLPNGITRIFAVVKMPLKDKDGKVIGIIGNSVEITELKKIEADLRIAKEKAEQANKAKTEFLNIAVKEIEEVLNSEKKIKSKNTKEYYNKIQLILNDIKNFAKFDLIESNVFSTEDASHSIRALKVSPKKIELFYEFYKKFMLTKREAECLYYFIRGLTVKQVAKNINLSNRTVEFYLNNAKLKLNCRTKQALISKVFESGIV